MARIRSIHPGLLTDEAFMQLTLEYPLGVTLLLGLWMEADDAGAFEWKPLTLKARCLPVVPIKIEDLLDVLARLNFIRRFEIGGRAFGVIRNFVIWQRPKKPVDVHPFSEASRAYAGFVDGVRPRAGTGRPRGGGEAELFEDASDETEAEFRTGSANGGTGSELGAQRKEEGGRREEEDPPPPCADARASRDRAFCELTGATVVAFPTGDALEAEARACALGLPLASDSNFEPVAALIASGAARRGDVLAAIEEARGKGEKCPRTWAKIADWAERKGRRRGDAGAGAGPPQAARPPPPWREDFERVWNGFPRDPTASRPRAEAAFAELSPAEQRDFAANIGRIAEHVRRQKLTSPHNLARFIAERRFEGFSAPAPQTRPMVKVQRDSEAGKAWEAHYRATRGKGAPWSIAGGFWCFDSEWPPGAARREGAG